MKKLITTLSALALASALSLAEDKPAGPPPGGPHPGGPGGPGGKRPNPEEVFKHLDTNHDHVLSLEEFKAGPRAQADPAKAEEIYKEMNKAGDGKLTLEEFKAHRPPHDGPGGDHKGPGGPEHKGPGDGAPKPPV